MRKSRLQRQRIRVCNKCGTPHVAVGIRQAQALLMDYNEFIDALPPEKVKEFQDLYLGSRRFDLEFFRCCAQCGNSHEDFHDPHPEDAPGKPESFRWILVERRRVDVRSQS